MSYTLTTSQRSPFGRICRMYMAARKIPFELRILNFVDDVKEAAVLAKESPINKVPILTDGAQKIFDSRVIVNHLMKKHGLPSLSLDEENIVSAIYSCMDVSVILFLMKRDGFNLDGDGFFIKRNRERIPNNLNFVTSWASELDPRKSSDWNYASMSLFAYLYWAEKRSGFLRIADYPPLKIFMDRFSNAPGVSETNFE